MESKERNKDPFIKVDRRRLYDIWHKGELSFKEVGALLDIMFKANMTTGVAIVPPIMAHAIELKAMGVLTSRDIVNELTKIYSNLKRKQRIWFENRTGTSKLAEVWINEFPKADGRFTDFSHLFQQNHSRTFEKDPISSAEVKNLEQNQGQNVEAYKDIKKPLLNSMGMTGLNRTHSRTHDPQIDRLEIDRKDRKIPSVIKLLKNKYPSKGENELMEAVKRANESGCSNGHIILTDGALEEFFNKN